MFQSPIYLSEQLIYLSIYSFRGNAIKIRRKDAVGGFFSQVGDLYMVHHLWGNGLVLIFEANFEGVSNDILLIPVSNFIILLKCCRKRIKNNFFNSWEF